MEPAALLTAADFEAVRPDLPDGGRWVELVAGRIVQFDPPDAAHGDVVLHLSKTLARYLEEHAATGREYICFDLGLLVRRDPDTVHYPAISFLSGGSRFAESDKAFTEVVPRLVVEIASTNARRRGLADRVSAYLRHGVDVVWIVDTLERCVHVARSGVASATYGDADVLTGEPVLPGMELTVAALFSPPDWWK